MSPPELLKLIMKIVQLFLWSKPPIQIHFSSKSFSITGREQVALENDSLHNVVMVSLTTMFQPDFRASRGDTLVFLWQIMHTSIEPVLCFLRNFRTMHVSGLDQWRVKRNTRKVRFELAKESWVKITAAFRHRRSQNMHSVQLHVPYRVSRSRT